MDGINQNTELDEIILARLKMKIITFERENYKTKKYTDSDMIQRIKKLIDEAVRTEGER